MKCEKEVEYWKMLFMINLDWDTVAKKAADRKKGSA